MRAGPTISAQIKSLLFSKNNLSRLLLINIAVFIFVELFKLYFYLFQIPEVQLQGKFAFSKVALWLAVPANIDILLQKPWTLFTYMFLHFDFFHLFFNMIMLYFGGTLFIQFLGGKKLISTYIFGGLAGALFYILAFNIFPVFAPIKDISLAMGASASVLAILVAIATYLPDYVIQLFLFGRVKLKYLALVLIAIDVMSIDGSNPGGHIAHLGGALWGFSYILLLKSRFDFYKIFNLPANFIKNTFKPKPKLRVEYTKPKRPVSDENYNKQRAEKQNKIDAILDKIKISGYDSLSKDEKQMLFSESEKR